ncbi:maltase A2 [Drosophila willistoni]|uniref:alpha-glucosidase n=1 Tax=Drosophila willistoni TaxID=7260 RepID=B4MQ25_DROWI|nr:maltase A2 [Drosophila willistoni]EDW74214.1 maltase A2 [Drosophila willistoni]
MPERKLVGLVWLTCLVVTTLGAQSDVDWWENAALYQIYPRSFQDSNGDGIGDLKGITTRLTYLKEIGITATWLSPIFTSPMSDFGYDISNFYDIDPIFGTLADFDDLIAKAKELKLKIILDFVPNHSSDECEWFDKSVNRLEGYDDFYVWDDGKVNAETGEREPPSNWISVFGGPQWTWHETRQQYFLHQFQVKQPDLNFSNPMVKEHMLDVLKFWLDRGVDGFRIDAVPHIYEYRYANGSYPDEPVSGWSSDPGAYEYHDHIYTKDQPATVELMYEWHEFLEQYQAENGGDTRVLLAEAYSSVETLSAYYGNGTRFGTQLPMNFQLMYLSGYSTAKDVVGSIDYWMDTMWTTHQTANWVVGNHDTQRVADRMGAHKVDLLNVIVSALPGASVTYYGEEIGMSNVDIECTGDSCEDRDGERTPMQWSPGVNAEFSTGESTWLPVNPDYERINVQTERGVARSSLQIFKGMQKLKSSSAFLSFKKAGGFSYEAVNEQVLQIIRTNKINEEYRILINMGNNMEVLEGLSDKTYEYILTTAYSTHYPGQTVDLGERIVLMPFEAIVLRWLA